MRVKGGSQGKTAAVTKSTAARTMRARSGADSSERERRGEEAAVPPPATEEWGGKGGR